MLLSQHCQAALDSIRQSLQEDPAGTLQEYRQLQQQLRQRGMLFQGKPLPICISPIPFGRQQIRPLQEQMRRLVRILAKLEPLLCQTEWLDRLGIHRSEQHLIQWPTRLTAGGHISRIDGFLRRSPQGQLDYQVIELNFDSPGGAAFMDESVRLLRQTSVWKRLTKKFPGKYLETDACDLALLLQHWEQWGGKGKPRIAVVDWITVNTAAEFELLKERYSRLGYPTVICDPRELEYRQGRLLDFAGQPIDLVYRRVLVEDLMSQPEAARPLLHAYKDQAVCVVNPLTCKPLTVKSLLSWIHRPEFEALLGAGDLQFLRSLIPWTADVEEGPVLERLRREREQTILKPADGYGGEGLYLGWELTQQDWEAGLQVAVKERYVAQQRVEIPQIELPMASESGWSFESFRMDFDPYMFAHRMADPLVRVAQSDVLNVKAGAQICAAWVLDDSPA